jgi:hypothetical protein
LLQAILNLMLVARDLSVVRVAVEGRGIVGRDVVSDLIGTEQCRSRLLCSKHIHAARRTLAATINPMA